MEHIENADKRYISASNEGKFTYTQELNILDHLVKRFNPISLAEYAKKEGISSAGALKRIESGKVMYVEIIGRKFIID